MNGYHRAANPAGKVTDKANRCAESNVGREVVTSPNRQVQKSELEIKAQYRALCAVDEIYALDNPVKLAKPDLTAN
jgi:hypothetical protein